ncbi:hypothetical protein ScPMuIL_006952 [Solemya velum]
MGVSVKGTVKMMVTGDAETRSKLLRAVKKEVKQIMEEAVTRKFVHEESSSITSLCGAVEACLLYGLKKRALGLFKHSTTTALLQKVSKNFEPAAFVVKLVTEIETNNDINKKSIDKSPPKRPSTTYNPKYLWIRLAIFEKQLAKILDYLVQNNGKFYESEALIADPVDGPIFASLLVGPCALDYTKMKTTDHFWTDPPADELVQRHRIHSGGNHHLAGPGSPKRPGLQVRRNTSSSSEESQKGFHLSAKEYVESLHQNSKTTLLYGKNNVLVQPKEDVESLPGYLSLHQTAEGLTIMWTPNQLMNGCCENKEEDIDRSLYWEYALTVFLDEIVYIHCHQQPDCGGTIVLVGQDGVQRPPIHFPKGGHLLAFLSCLENGLLPHGQLDPPLWSQRGKGKVFPKLRRKGSRLSSRSKEDSTSSSSTDEDEATDYVFRIITTFKPENIPPEMLDPKAKVKGDLFPWYPTMPRVPSPLVQSSVQSYAIAQEEQNNSCLSKSGTTHRNTLKQLCDTMKKQIISRAFYGWLAHCRHLKTVRTHLSGLVHHTIVSIEIPLDASLGLTQEIWAELNHNGIVTKSGEIFRLIYHGGVAHEIRNEVWPYLLGHYKFGTTCEERESVDAGVRTLYERTMSEWLAIEAIIKQRDKEIMVANLAKLSSETDGHISLARKDSSLSNDVFESQSFDESDTDFSPPETLPEERESSATGTTCTPTTDRKQSLMDFNLQTEMTDQVTQTELVVDRPEQSKSFSDSPDDGLGDSIARQSSPERSKLDSAGSVCDSEGTDLSKADRDGSVERTMIPPKLSTDSAGVDDREECMMSDASRSMILSVDSADDDYSGGDRTDHHDAEDEQSEGRDEEEMEESGPELLPKPMEMDSSIPHEQDRIRHLSASHESLISPASPASNGGIYSPELLDTMALNLHRIDKDVQRCDRNYWYFNLANLEKLRNVMCTYVWEHLDVGYVQGMCDLVAPLLVIFDDESKTYSCFCELMKRMSSNFPHGGAMDTHFANMRSLIQILDSELFEHMHQHGDYTHFYFCYRWFLLDFKRELVYDDVFSVWETIWAAKPVSSAHFVLFIALALVEYYREIILDNNMDFTDIIKFFNEMAERHNAKQVLKIARDLVLKLQTLIENNGYEFVNSGCPHRKLINGEEKLSLRGWRAKYQCLPGYELVGAASSFCLMDRWSTPLPVCIEVKTKAGEPISSSAFVMGGYTSPIPTEKHVRTTDSPNLSTADDSTQMPNLSTADDSTQMPYLSTADDSTQMPYLSTADDSTQMPYLSTADGSTQMPYLSTTDDSTQMPNLSTADDSTQMPYLSTADDSTQMPYLSTADDSTQMPYLSTADDSTQMPYLSTTDDSTQMPNLSTADDRTRKPYLSTADDSTQMPYLPTADDSTQMPYLSTTDDSTQMPYSRESDKRATKEWPPKNTPIETSEEKESQSGASSSNSDTGHMSPYTPYLIGGITVLIAVVALAILYVRRRKSAIYSVGSFHPSELEAVSSQPPQK